MIKHSVLRAHLQTDLGSLQEVRVQTGSGHASLTRVSAVYGHGDELQPEI